MSATEKTRERVRAIIADLTVRDPKALEQWLQEGERAARSLKPKQGR